jgi:hypothetical protein
MEHVDPRPHDTATAGQQRPPSDAGRKLTGRLDPIGLHARIQVFLFSAYVSGRSARPYSATPMIFRAAIGGRLGDGTWTMDVHSTEAWKSEIKFHRSAPVSVRTWTMHHVWIDPMNTLFVQKRDGIDGRCARAPPDSVRGLGSPCSHGGIILWVFRVWLVGLPVLSHDTIFKASARTRGSTVSKDAGKSCIHFMQKSILLHYSINSLFKST